LANTTAARESAVREETGIAPDEKKHVDHLGQMGYNKTKLRKQNVKAVNRMEEERDLVVFSDDEGNEFELEVIDYFDHEGQEYAVLVDPEGCGCEDETCEHEHETEVYIMKVVVNGEYEEFLPADEDKMEALSALVEQRFEAMEDDDEDDEDDEDGCSCCCGCGHGEKEDEE